MPVDDHPVHPSTVKQEHHEHCWNNRPERKGGYWAQDGWIHMDLDVDGMPRMSSPRWVWIHTMPSAYTCAQPGNGFKPQPTCIGCRHLGES